MNTAPPRRDDIHSYEPRLGHGLPHDPFNAIVGPRPIGWISTQNAAGATNLAPYSFFNAFNYVPPIVGFASIGFKDTVRNVQETGEFVWNLATRDLAEVMNQSCAAVPPEVSEFDLTGLTPFPPPWSHRRAWPKAPSPLNAAARRSCSCRAWTAPRWTPGWCWARWWPCTSTRRCSRTGCTTRRTQATSCAGGPADYFTVGPEQLFRMFRPR